MDTMELIDRTNTVCDDLTSEDDAHARKIMNVIADSWSLWVINVLGEHGRLRFSRIQERITGISQKMLTKTLRQLEAEGLLTRTMYLEVPPRVEYELTPLGSELLAHVLPLWLWVAQNITRFQPSL